MSALLEMDAVRVALGGRPVLEGASLCVRPGELVGLLGPNGAGKTTLVRAATGVVPRSGGRVHVGGRDLEELDRRSLACTVAVVPQAAEVPFAFRVEDVVLMGRTPRLGWLAFESAHDRDVAREAMARVGVLHLADRPLLALSGGERQLVWVARALAQEPKLLLLDEPTAHLDLRHRLEVLEVVEALLREGRGALWVSHDLALAARFCHRIVLLAEGRTVSEGPPRDVLSPERIARVFGVEARVVDGPDGAPVVVPVRAVPPPAPPR